jgi:hypothetical protein
MWPHSKWLPVWRDIESLSTVDAGLCAQVFSFLSRKIYIACNERRDSLESLNVIDMSSDD